MREEEVENDEEAAAAADAVVEGDAAVGAAGVVGVMALVALICMNAMEPRPVNGCGCRGCCGCDAAGDDCAEKAGCCGAGITGPAPTVIAAAGALTVAGVVLNGIGVFVWCGLAGLLSACCGVGVRIGWISPRVSGAGLSVVPSGIARSVRYSGVWNVGRVVGREPDREPEGALREAK